MAHAREIPILATPDGNPNDPSFVARLVETTRPDVALSYYSTRIWKADLLRAFPQAMNYHDGLLPWYKGLAATSFSMYNGERVTGFTFHRMTEGIDAGPILVQGSIPINDSSVFANVDRQKAAAAVASLPQVFDLIATNDPGRPQTEPGSYFSGRDYHALIQAPRPEQLTAAELRRRIRAFGTIRVTIDGAEWPVTRVCASQPGRPLTFRTADGAYLAADRIRGLPVRLARRPT